MQFQNINLHCPYSHHPYFFSKETSLRNWTIWKKYIPFNNTDSELLSSVQNLIKWQEPSSPQVKCSRLLIGGRSKTSGYCSGAELCVVCWTFFVILFGNQFGICFCWHFPPVVNILVHFSKSLQTWKAGNLSSGAMTDSSPPPVQAWVMGFFRKEETCLKAEEILLAQS